MNHTPGHRLTMHLLPDLIPKEVTALEHIAPLNAMHARAAADLARLIIPIDKVTSAWDPQKARSARLRLLKEVHQQQKPYWTWDEETWAEAAAEAGAFRFHVAALGHQLGGHHRLHGTAGITSLARLADLVFGPQAIQPAVDAIAETLTAWRNSTHLLPWQVRNATIDVLLSNNSPHLEDLGEPLLEDLMEHYRSTGATSRRRGLFKISRVLADKGIISSPLRTNQDKAGPESAALATVPPPWRDAALRWMRLVTHEPGTKRSMLSAILVAGRWAAEKHPEAVAPEHWTRDIAAEYIADTMTATVGQWAGHSRNRSRFGQPLSPAGKANRIDSIRGFFNDLIEWEWIKPRFDPRQVLSMPLSLRALMGPNPRIIDDATWAKLMAAGLTLNSEDLKPYGTPRARSAGWQATYYPIEMVRAMVGVWLFAGCRMDELRRLDLDCITWDEGTDERTGETYPICLLHIPQNKTSRPFAKPVDPLVGELIDAWKLVRSPQPDLADRKTGLPRQHLFCHRGQLVGNAYLNDNIIPALCQKAGIPAEDSRGALTSHRARSTIATQLLNARDPLTLGDLQQWLGHKHPASTRYYAKILQRTLTAAYRKADYFARNIRTIEGLIDRDSILTGAAASGEQPWKYYDLGDGYCSYDFFAKCPHRMACARCPFYVPKESTKGQLLAVKDGINKMLEQVDLTDEEREALEGDRDAVTALAQRLADVPTPAGPTPRDLGTTAALIPLTQLTDTIKLDQEKSGQEGQASP
ncbi:tyrosine-type recombinase/integrase [Streptomyces flaveolus]|uniref:tyrosine-type recombinase/integrase n=1 Tax=Streptomyces flaveolus TaxID=67297 RepID=UPI003326E42F